MVYASILAFVSFFIGVIAHINIPWQKKKLYQISLGLLCTK
jgi:hypothetical protein